MPHSPVPELDGLHEVVIEKIKCSAGLKTLKEYGVFPDSASNDVLAISTLLSPMPPNFQSSWMIGERKELENLFGQ